MTWATKKMRLNTRAFLSPNLKPDQLILIIPIPKTRLYIASIEAQLKEYRRPPEP
ncbi:helicase [Sesbania bispinosa]|nr:helicase [Sesbania bispinosa]